MQQKRPRVVIDTNLFVSGSISPRGVPSRLLRMWEQNRIIVVTSSELVAEVEAVLHRDSIKGKYQLAEERIRELVRRLQQAAEHVTPLSPLPLHSTHGALTVVTREKFAVLLLTSPSRADINNFKQRSKLSETLSEAQR